MADILDSYPRDAYELSPAYKAIYAEEYKANREGDDVASGAAQKLEQWMHRKVASVAGGPILEIGAGTLNHRQYEAADAVYDIVEPFTSLYAGKPELASIRDVYDFQADVPAERRYKRIISIAVLEHLHDLPREVAMSVIRLDDDGVYQAGIPSEGGLLWWLGWRGTTGLSFFLRHKMNYGEIMRHEHVSKAKDIVAVVRHFFDEVELTRWPVPSDHASFYQYIEARGPRKAVASRFLEAN